MSGYAELGAAVVAEGCEAGTASVDVGDGCAVGRAVCDGWVCECFSSSCLPDLVYPCR